MRVRAWSCSCVDQGVSPLSNRSEVETLIGRSLAMCVHPYAAWRSRSPRRRVFVFSAYTVGTYALVLCILELVTL